MKEAMEVYDYGTGHGESYGGYVGGHGWLYGAGYEGDHGYGYVGVMEAVIDNWRWLVVTGIVMVDMEVVMDMVTMVVIVKEGIVDMVMNHHLHMNYLYLHMI